MFQKLSVPILPTCDASKAVLYTRVKELETVRLHFAGGDNKESAKLLAAELHHLPNECQAEVLEGAGIRCPRPPPDLGLQLRTSMHSWTQFRDLKRLNIMLTYFTFFFDKMCTQKCNQPIDL